MTLTASADTCIRQNSTGNNWGSYTFMWIGCAGKATNAIRRGLVEFDLSGIPAGSTINSATLKMQLINSHNTSQNIQLFRTLVDWGEGTGTGKNGTTAAANTASWTDRLKGTAAWAVGGGKAGTDYTSTASASTAVTGTGSYNWTNLTADVQYWLDNPASNFGWFILSNKETTQKDVVQIATRENGTAGNRPSLTIDYTAPAPKSNTTTALVANPTAATTYGDSITYTATVTVVAPGTGTPTGTVTFLDGAASIGTGTLNASGVASLTTTVLASGSHTITASYGGDANDNASTSTAVTSTVNKATLTVTANNLNRAYGDANPTLTAAYTGFKNGQTLATSGVTGSPALSTTATAASPVGNYPITAAAGTLAAANYQFTMANGQLTVNKATLTVTADSLNRAYGDANPTLTATYTGFKNGETLATSGVTGSPVLSTAATAASSPGNYPITAAAGTLAATNYQFTTANGQLTVNKAPLTVTADNAARLVGLPNPPFTASYAGFKNGETLATSGVTGSPSLTCAANTASPAGNYPIVAAQGTLAATNYSFTMANGTLQVTDVPKTSTTTTLSADASTSVYGDAITFTATVAVVPPATGTPTGTVTFLDNGVAIGSASLTGGVGTLVVTSLAAGSHSIVASYGGDSSNAASISGAKSISVGQATLTITAANASRVVGTPNPTFSANYSGFKNGETLATSGVTGSPSLTCAATTASPIGNYPIVAGAGTLAAANYGFSFVNGTLRVTAVPNAATTTVVTALPATSTYGSSVTLTATVSVVAPATGTPTGTVTFLDGAVSLGTRALNASGVATLTTTTLAAGTRSITATYDGDALNDPSTSPVVTETVNKAVLTVTATNAGRLYGDPDPTFTATYSGFKNGETAGTAGLTGDPGFTTTAVAKSPVGVYPITPNNGTLAAANYTFVHANGQLTIGKATLTVVADNANRAYGDPNPAFTAGYIGFKNNETFATAGISGSPSLISPATPSSPVGPYPIVAGAGTLTSTNYQFTALDGLLTVDKAALTAVADNLNRGYGDPNPILTYSLVGLKNGETSATAGVTGDPILSTTATAASSVGVYPIVASIGTLAAANYEISPANGQLTVDKAILTLTADNASRTYGDANPALSATLSGFKNGETLATSGVSGSAVLTTPATATSPVGNYPIIPSAGTLTSVNYGFAPVNGWLTVEKATLTGKVNDASRPYGDPNPMFTASFAGFKNGETAATAGVTGAIHATTTAVKSSPIGIYPVTADAGTLAATNYRFGDVLGGQLTVTKAMLWVIAANVSRPIGDPNPALTANYIGFKNGENLATSGVSGTPVLTTAANASTSVGFYLITISAGTLAATNYQFTLGDGILTVTMGNMPENYCEQVVDVIDPPGSVLYVNGTSGKDVIQIAKANAAGDVSVTINNLFKGVFYPSNRIIVYGLAGDDYIGVASGITLASWLYGGEGNDLLYGGGGANMLLGGGGNDQLQGGLGANLLIGGLGSDVLLGGRGGSILISGITNYDSNEAALLALLKEWSRPADYNTRVGNVTGATPAPNRLNGTFYLNATTVRRDASLSNRLSGTPLGTAAVDLFFAGFGDTIGSRRTSEKLVSIR